MRLRSERGSTIVIVLISLSLALMLAGVAVTNTVQALRTSGHEANVKRAQAAADAAVEDAMFALNRLDLTGALDVDPLQPDTVPTQSCVVSSSGGELLDLVPLASADGWCPEKSSGTLGSGASYSYRVSSLARVGNGVCGDGALLSLDRRIVAVGRSGDVARRISARLRAPVSLFSGAAVQSGSTSVAMTMAGSARVTGNVHANASITGTGGAPIITGNATAGYDAAVSGIVPAGVTGSACQRFLLPPVDQSDAATVNSNGAQDWSSYCVDWAAGLIPIPCEIGILPATGGTVWDVGARTLRVWGNARVVLTGSTYSFCRIELENQAMIVVPNSSAATRIFLDDPANCPNVSGAGTITSDGLSRIVNCHLQTQPETLQLYALGSSATATTQTLAGAGPLSPAQLSTACGLSLPAVGTPMVLYAPRSQVDLAGTVAISGTVAGNVVHLSGASSVTSINSLINLNALGARPVLPLYRPQQYVSCTATDFAHLPAADPATGC